MRIEDLLYLWGTAPSSDSSFQRIDDKHILDIYVGKDNDSNRELMVISDVEPAKINSSKVINIQKGIRKDNRWATRIRLMNEGEAEVFTHLCWDLIEHSRKATSSSLALEILIARFLKWQKLMESGGDLLPESVIRGLMGEILYSRKVLRNNMNWDEILTAWLGPDGSDRDFVFKDTWSEVKTIRTGKQTITISSIEQLDSDREGTLAVVFLDNTSAFDTDGISFAGLIDDIRNELRSNPSSSFLFESKLLEVGYSEHVEYYEKYYVFRLIKTYSVSSEFPRLTKTALPEEIIEARYDISLSGISEFEVRG